MHFLSSLFCRSFTASSRSSRFLKSPFLFSFSGDPVERQVPPQFGMMTFCAAADWSPPLATIFSILRAYASSLKIDPCPVFFFDDPGFSHLRTGFRVPLISCRSWVLECSTPRHPPDSTLFQLIVFLCHGSFPVCDRRCRVALVFHLCLFPYILVINTVLLFYFFFLSNAICRFFCEYSSS